jgi:hypothetical protein
VTAAAAEEHERHQTASNEKRKESAETEDDPAVLIHHHVAGGIPYRRCPYASEHQQGNESRDNSDLAKAKFLTWVAPFPFYLGQPS